MFERILRSLNPVDANATVIFNVKNLDDSTSAFEVALATNAMIGLAMLLTFSCVRRRDSFKWLYEARLSDAHKDDSTSHLPSFRPEKSFWGWVKPTLAVSDDELLASAGLDAFMFCQFFKCCAKIFFCCLLYGGFVLIPLNSLGKVSNSGLRTLSFANVHHSQGVAGDPNPGLSAMSLWAGVLGMYLFSLATFYFTRKTYMVYVEARHSYLEALHRRGHKMTVMVEDLPVGCGTEPQLLALFAGAQGLFPRGAVRSVTLVRKVRALETLLRRRRATLMRLQAARAASLRGQGGEINLGACLGLCMPCLPCCAQPTLEGLQQQLEEIEEELATMRAEAFDSAGVGFVTFQRAVTAWEASHAVLDGEYRDVSARVAPAPNDVAWQQVAAGNSAWVRQMRRILAAALKAVLLLFWMVPVFAVASLLNLNALEGWLGSGRLGGFVQSFLQGFGATVLLRLCFLLLLPYLLLGVGWVRGPRSHSALQVAAAEDFFVFLIFNGLFVTTVSGSVLAVLRQIIDHPPEVVHLLGAALPDMAVFFCNYAMFQAFCSLPLSLLAPSQLFLYQWNRLCCGPLRLPGGGEAARSGRWKAGKEPLPFHFDYYVEYPNHLFIFAICFTYATVAPYILPFGFIYFAIGYVAKKYAALYMHTPAFDSGGAFWPMAFGRLLVGVLLGQLTFLGVLGAKLAAAQSLVLFPLPAATLYFYMTTEARLRQRAHGLPIRRLRALQQEQEREEEQGDEGALAGGDKQTGLAAVASKQQQRWRKQGAAAGGGGSQQGFQQRALVELEQFKRQRGVERASNEQTPLLSLR